MTDYAKLVHPPIMVVISDDGEHCGMSCPYLRQYSARFVCSLFRCDLYSGEKVERNPSCIGAAKKEI